MPARRVFDRQLLKQLVHELFTEAKLPGMLLPFRPELEGVDDAHVQQPPCQARPRAHGLSAWEVGVVKLRQHIDRAGAVEVVADGARAADRNLPACVAPAIE